jgi:hypothetical protein
MPGFNLISPHTLTGNISVNSVALPVARYRLPVAMRFWIWEAIWSAIGLDNTFSG